MTFSAPGWLWLLAGLAPLTLLEWRAARRAQERLRRLVGSRADHALLLQCRPGQRRLGMMLRAGAFALLAVGAAGPEWGREIVRRAASGSDVVLLVDVSSSMDARDVPPSRLEETRREALAVLERLEGSRVGVVAFAGDAVRLCPLTLDRGAVRLVLESIGTGSVSEPGTDLGRGLRMAARLLPGGRRSEQMIVLWTDGEDLENGAAGAIGDLAGAGCRVLTVGVGTRAGDVVPVLDDLGRAVDVKRDAAGEAVRSHLDEALLRTLARRTGGAFVPASRPGGELPRLLAALGAVSRGARGQRLVEHPVPRFPWFAGLAAVLIAAELGRARRRRPEAGLAARATTAVARPSPAADGARRAAVALTLTLTLATGLAGRARAQSDWARGDREFRQRHYPAAESLYARRLARGGPDAARVNRATAAALAGRAAHAESLLATLTEAALPAGPTAAYNLGTLQAGRGAYETALVALRRALERDPDDQDARFNFELALRRQRERAARGTPPPTPRAGTPAPQGAGPDPRSGGRAPEPPPGPAPSPPRAPGSPPPAPGSMDQRMAEQLLGSLAELERLERRHLRQVRVMRERRGRDW